MITRTVCALACFVGFCACAVLACDFDLRGGQTAQVESTYDPGLHRRRALVDAQNVCKGRPLEVLKCRRDVAVAWGL